MLRVPAAKALRTGIVVSWKIDQGYGFIRPEGAERDLFAHVSNVAGFEELRAGSRVSFEEGISERSGKAEARNVRLAQ